MDSKTLGNPRAVRTPRIAPESSYQPFAHRQPPRTQPCAKPVDPSGSFGEARASLLGAHTLSHSSVSWITLCTAARSLPLMYWDISPIVTAHCIRNASSSFKDSARHGLSQGARWASTPPANPGKLPQLTEPLLKCWILWNRNPPEECQTRLRRSRATQHVQERHYG